MKIYTYYIYICSSASTGPSRSVQLRACIPEKPEQSTCLFADGCSRSDSVRIGRSDIGPVILEIGYGSVFGRPADHDATRPADGKDFAGYTAYGAIYRKSSKVHWKSRTGKIP